MHQFLSTSLWQKHIGGHFQALSNATVCSHPQCDISFDSVGELQHHLQDIHLVKFNKGMKRCRSGFDTEVNVTQVKRPRRNSKQNPKTSLRKTKSTKQIHAFKKAQYTFITVTAENAHAKLDRPTRRRKQTDTVHSPSSIVRDSSSTPNLEVEGLQGLVNLGRCTPAFSPSVSKGIFSTADNTTDEEAEANTPKSFNFLENVDPESSPLTDLGFQDEISPRSAFAGTVQDLSPPPVDPEDNQYSVESLLERRVRRLGGRNRRKVIQYLVKWEGYGNEHNSWVNETGPH